MDKEYVAAMATPADIEQIEREAYARGRYDEREELESVLPGTYYMDPPDGGAPTIMEQLQRMAEDAARYRWLRDISDELWPLALRTGFDATEVDAAIDAARGVTDSHKQRKTEPL